MSPSPILLFRFVHPFPYSIACQHCDFGTGPSQDRKECVALCPGPGQIYVDNAPDGQKCQATCPPGTILNADRDPPICSGCDSGSVSPGGDTDSKTHHAFSLSIMSVKHGAQPDVRSCGQLAPTAMPLHTPTTTRRCAWETALLGRCTQSLQTNASTAVQPIRTVTQISAMIVARIRAALEVTTVRNSMTS